MNISDELHKERESAIGAKAQVTIQLETRHPRNLRTETDLNQHAGSPTVSLPATRFLKFHGWTSIGAAGPREDEFTIMDLTRTAYGTWSGGRFMHFGEPLPEERFLTAIRHAYDKGIRTFMTADVYSNGGADEMLGRALAGIPRDTYSLVGIIGHDFYSGQRDG